MNTEYVGLIEIMPPATLYGVGVITKLYFAILRHLIFLYQ